MAMTINGTSLAYAGMRNANKSVQKTSTALQRISTGLKINSAKDDPAGFVISELLRSQAGATQAALQNTREANNLLSIAEGGLGSMQENLRQMKGLAIHALNSGITSPEQVSADQAVLNSLLQTMQRTADTTRYADQNLLDGSRNDPTAEPQTAFQVLPEGGGEGGRQLQLGGGSTEADRQRVNLPNALPANLGQVEQGGKTYSLNDLYGGGDASLAQNPELAIKIIDQAIMDVSAARAGIGAYQANQLDANANNLEIELANLVATESYIRDTDIARQATEMAQAQTQMQAGLKVIAKANQLARQNAMQLIGAPGAK